MGRTKNFDEEAVLKKAMHAFRQHGYNAITIPQLVAVTGLSAGSIYHSYGDKNGLFNAAFESYLEQVLQGRIARHADEKRGLNGVRQLFLSLLEEPNNEHFGCLITNSAIEFGDDQSVCKNSVQRGFDILLQALIHRLTQAQQLGRLRPGLVVLPCALKLLALYQGILVMVRSGYEKAPLRGAIEQEFSSILLK